MKTFQNLLGGLAGALALNLLHETVKRLDHDAPRIDLVGEEALSKTIEATGGEAPTGNKLFGLTLAADVTANAGFYSLIGQGKDENILTRGAVFGLVAGIGALALTEPMGLDDAPITKTTRTKVLTVAWYLAGGLVTALTIRAIRD